MNPQLLPALSWIIDILNQNNISYILVGGLAAHIYGASRNINDIDLDVSERDITKLLHYVGPYIIYGPTFYKDSRWNIKLLTLNYFGQKIDISVAENQQIYNDETNQWTIDSSDLTKYRLINFENIALKVIEPSELINYKKLLAGKHQKHDIDAVKKFLLQNQS